MIPIADSVWQLTGYPAHYVNSYLLEDILIDAATRWASGRIFRQLRGRCVSMVALTHCHPDHQGSAKAVCAKFGVPLACHNEDVACVEGRMPMLPHNRLLRLGQWLWAGPPCEVGRVLRDGDIIAGFRVVHAPGHTPGHCMFFRESDRVCIAGDVLANINVVTGKPGLRQPPPMFSADAAQNRRSIRLLADLHPSIVCFGHGPPLREPQLLMQYVAALRR
ncbi:MAG TPA: MBL fold metallo-hydrolase [Gemmataceae bacterium]|nr:MBL fold metallo-hydrolase [Gemmataceae bacterium]